MAKQILNIPIGYAASFTTDALTSGSYTQYDNNYTGYAPVTIDVSTSYTIGPFNEATNFEFTTDGDNRITFTLTPSGVYTAADDAGIMHTTNTVADLTPLGQANLVDLGILATGIEIADAVNGILAILLAAGLMDAAA